MYRENMRKRARKPGEYEEFIFRRENVFDFDAWYRAHFHDDFDTKLRDERIKTYSKQYEEQMKRILEGQHIRPPRPFVERKELSDIEKQMIEMEENEIKKDIRQTLKLAGYFLITFLIITYIIDKRREEGPYEDLYVKKKQLAKTEEK